MRFDFLLKTFRGGRHIRDYKEFTADIPSRDAPVPDIVRIPVSQHAGKPAVPAVKAGDTVKTGQLIAAASGAVSANIHSSVTGRVTAVDRYPVSVGGEGICIEIKAEGEEEKEYIREDADNIIKRMRDAGIAGMGGAMFPADIKLSPPKDKNVDVFILNAAECEPFVTCDYRLMLEAAHKVVEGMRLCMRAAGIKRGIIGIEADKPKAAEAIRKEANGLVEVVLLKTKYPQGGEKQLIKAVLGREVPSGKLPFEAGVIVQNAGTAAAVYDAVREGKPLYERLVTVTGRCVREPANLRVRIGTMFSDLIKWCGGLKYDAGKLIMGGPMMGAAQYTFDVPVVKGTNAVLVMPRDEVTELKKEPCVRCGRCVSGCPMFLDPGRLGTLIERGRLSDARQEGLADCIECGLCEYSCIGNRDLVQLIRYAKRKK